MGSVEHQKRELCKQAYLLIHKYLAVVGMEGQDSFEFRKNLRKKNALDIDLATNKEILAELNKFKEQGGAALLASKPLQPSYGGGGSGGGGVKAAKSKGAGGGPMSGAAGLPPLGPGAGGGGGGSRSAAKPSKSAPRRGGKGDGGPVPSSLPARIGMKVNRWWAKEGQWYTAVITDFNSETNEYRLTYNLCSQNETYEDFNLDMADSAIYEITGDKINLLAKTGSAAVNNSTVLKPFLARSGGGGGGGGGGGASKSKKRRSENDDDDSDY